MDRTAKPANKSASFVKMDWKLASLIAAPFIALGGMTAMLATNSASTTETIATPQISAKCYDQLTDSVGLLNANERNKALLSPHGLSNGRAVGPAERAEKELAAKPKQLTKAAAKEIKDNAPAIDKLVTAMGSNQCTRPIRKFVSDLKLQS